MRVGVAQIATRAGDLQRTGERIVEQSRRAAEQGVELLVFPVATLTGPFVVPRADQRGLLTDVIARMMEITSELACPCLVPIVTAMNGTPMTEVFLLAEGDAVPLRFRAMMLATFGAEPGPLQIGADGWGGDDARMERPGQADGYAEDGISPSGVAGGGTSHLADPSRGAGVAGPVDWFDADVAGASMDDLIAEIESAFGNIVSEDAEVLDDAYYDALEEGLGGERGERLGAADWLDESEDDDADMAPSAADGFAAFEVGGVRFVLACGYDDLYELVDYDYEMDAVIFLPAMGFAMDEPARALGAALAESEFRQDARTCGAWLVAAGSLGCYDNAVYTGGSFVLSPEGELVASAPSFEEALIVAEIASDEAYAGAAPGGSAGTAADDGAPTAWEPAAGGMGHVIPALDAIGSASSTPAVGTLEPEVYDAPFFCWEALTMGLRDYVHNLGRTDVALALDGTQASSALAVLACDALGPTHVHALLATPLAGTSLARGRGSGRGSAAWRSVVAAARRERSCRRLAANLRLELAERDQRLLGVTAAMLEDAYAEVERLKAADVEEGVARTELARIAAETGSLTLSAHDKTWLALEARSGDSAADLLPFGDLYRSDVLELARMRNVISPVIPDLKLAACDMPCVELEEREHTSAPARAGSLTAGEAPDQGLLRDVDSVLAGRLEWGRTIAELAQAVGEEELVLAVLAQVARHAPMRAAAGVVLQVGSTGIDDERLSYGMAWHDVARPEEPTGDDLLRSLREAMAGEGQEGGLVGMPSLAAWPADGDPSAARRAGGSSPTAASGGTWDDEDSFDPSDILGYLRDLADELGAGSSGAHGSGGYIATDGESHFGFGGFTDGNPFSDN